MSDCVTSANIVYLTTHRVKAASTANCSHNIGPNGEFREFGEFISPAPQAPIHCELSLLINNQGYATKVFDLDDKGQLRTRSAANIYEGRVKRLAIDSLEELLPLLESLPSERALCFGLPDKEEANLITQETLRAGSYPNAVARDREHFAFRKGHPGIMMFDCDARPGKTPLNWHDIDQIIGQIIPEWLKTQRIWRASSSAFVYSSDGSELIGVGGWRCYMMVDDASSIPAVGAFLYQRLWELGHGYILISHSGQALDRSLIDASVWQPERVDFAAPPVLSSGLERRPPKPELLGSVHLLATASIKAPLTLAEWRREAEVLRRAKEVVKPQCLKTRKAYVAERIEALKREFPKTSEKRLRTLMHRAAETHVLTSDFVLDRPDGTRVTVGEVLADPDKWHQARFADPLEPSYRDDKRIAFANLEPNPGEDPFLWSHAHGGMRYRLVRESAALTLRKGERPRVLDGSLAIIRGRGELFERGGEIVRIAGDLIRPAIDIWLGDYLGRHIEFKEMKFQNGDWLEVPADPPTWLCQQINAKTGERGLRDLNGIITAPTLRPDGSLLCTPGYDETTGLLLRGSGWPHIPENPTEADLHAAYKTLWTPFAEFPFVTKEDRGVMLACLLTAMLRRNLPHAPAFSFDAPAAGSGKTLLGQCLLRLCGTTPTVIPECREEEELRKRLLAALREGKPGILLDNIRGLFGSAALEAFLTSEYYADRVLGVSTILTLPTNVLLLISGNNFHPQGDLYRRILTARIDAKTDEPERRCFEIEPLEYCQEHRQELVAAALTLLRGFVAAGKPRMTKDRLASFEQWDDLIRQAVLWIAQQGIADVGDPTTCIQTAKEQEPERQKLAAFLEATATFRGGDEWRVADLVRKASEYDCADRLGPSALLKDALDEIAGEHGKINARRLGRWIERYDGTRCSGYFLERVGTKQNAAIWRVRTYGSRVHIPVGPENNSRNSRNSHNTTGIPDEFFHLAQPLPSLPLPYRIRRLERN